VEGVGSSAVAEAIPYFLNRSVPDERGAREEIEDLSTVTLRRWGSKQGELTLG
jgi:hypothetical protein